jgi:hypothetical protein
LNPRDSTAPQRHPSTTQHSGQYTACHHPSYPLLYCCLSRVLLIHEVFGKSTTLFSVLIMRSRAEYLGMLHMIILLGKEEEIHKCRRVELPWFGLTTNDDTQVSCLTSNQGPPSCPVHPLRPCLPRSPNASCPTVSLPYASLASLF